MSAFAETYQAVLQALGGHGKMALATSDEAGPSVRMMSLVLLEGKLYFQTDCTMRKAQQLREIPRAAVCVDNLQIEGACVGMGRPMEHAAFRKAYAEAYPSSFEMYSGLADERLYELRPEWVQRWSYEGGRPVVEQWDVLRETYTKSPYAGE